MKTLVALFFLSLLSPLAQAQYNGVPFFGDRAVCQTVTETVTSEQQAVIDQTIGGHTHRLYHWLWHSTRNGWSNLSAQNQALVTSLSPQWGQHTPICPRPTNQNWNPSGEEFLRMHHQMIDGLRADLVAAGQPCIAAWTSIPAANDPTWPVPAGTFDDSSKSEVFSGMLQAWSRTFMDTGFLTTHSLSEVGYLLEFSIHNGMHMRWSPVPGFGDDYSPVNAGITTVEGLLAPSPFDSPVFNYLGNPFSASVNPVFWKLHGWVDGVVVEWLRVNGYMYIADDCTGLTACYPWQSRWTGMNPTDPMGGGAAMEHSMHAGHQMSMAMATPAPIDQALAQLAPAASFRNFAFDDFLNNPRGGAGDDGTGGMDLNDPAVYVDQFGPCGRAP